MFYYGPANVRKIAGEFLSEFDAEFFRQNFRPSFSRISGPPKIHAQNARPETIGNPLRLHFLEPKCFAPVFCLLRISKKRVFWKKTFSLKCSLSRDSRFEILGILEIPQSGDNKAQSEHFLEQPKRIKLSKQKEEEEEEEEEKTGKNNRTTQATREDEGTTQKQAQPPRETAVALLCFVLSLFSRNIELLFSCIISVTCLKRQAPQIRFSSTSRRTAASARHLRCLKRERE